MFGKFQGTLQLVNAHVHAHVHVHVHVVHVVHVHVHVHVVHVVHVVLRLRTRNGRGGPRIAATMPKDASR